MLSAYLSISEFLLWHYELKIILLLIEDMISSSSFLGLKKLLILLGGQANKIHLNSSFFSQKLAWTQNVILDMVR